MFGIQTYSQSEYETERYFDAVFSGNYPKGKQVMIKLYKKYPNSLKTKLIIANYYSLMYETTDKQEKYFILTKKYADEAIKLLNKKEELTNEDVFRIISAKSILLKTEVQKKNYLKAAKNMQSVIKHFEYATKHEEDDKMKFISGMYNYYVETAKKDYPIIYPVLLFYPSGSKTKGLKLLKECTKSEDINIRIRSFLQLALIYYRDEKNINISEKYFESLLKIYPENLIWQTEYLKALKKNDLTNKYKNRQLIISRIIKENSKLTTEQKKYFTKIAEL